MSMQEIIQFIGALLGGGVGTYILQHFFRRSKQASEARRANYETEQLIQAGYKKEINALQAEVLNLEKRVFDFERKVLEYQQRIHDLETANAEALLKLKELGG